MPHPKIRFDELITTLRKRHFRLTPQRVELVRLISASDGHPSAAQLYARIKAQFPTMSQATVYKTLTLLKEMNQVLEIDLRNDSHYDGNRPGLLVHGDGKSRRYGRHPPLQRIGCDGGVCRIGSAILYDSFLNPGEVSSIRRPKCD
jgi:hypothetical protein